MLADAYSCIVCSIWLILCMRLGTSRDKREEALIPPGARWTYLNEITSFCWWDGRRDRRIRPSQLHFYVGDYHSLSMCLTLSIAASLMGTAHCVEK
jgi:hypothetical protein